MAKGKLTVITGSVCSGKSERLIQELHRCAYAGKKVFAFKHFLDDREGLSQGKPEYINSRNGQYHSAVAVHDAIAIVEYLAEVDMIHSVVAIEEAQFFDFELPSVVEWLLHYSDVFVVGLDTDFKQEGFNFVPELMARAEKVIKLHAVCVVCKGTAQFTQRLVDGVPAERSDTLILVGDSCYEARCRNCHEITSETAQDEQQTASSIE